MSVSIPHIISLSLLISGLAAGAGNQWKSIVSTSDPTAPLLREFRKAKPLPGATLAPTELGRADYLKLIASEIDFWKTHQADNGAILDPYSRQEVQYSTPAFAHAAAGLVVWSQRDDLLEPAAKALDWAVQGLSTRRAASGHEDFYPTMIAHAMGLLESRVAPERYKRWEEAIANFDPDKVYRMAPGSMNWNIVSLCGEEMFRQMGIRKDDRYVEKSLAAQGHHFHSPFGLYCEGPMAYDLFPRLFLDDILASGYDGDHRDELEALLGRAAIASLFMQSPWGELPAGGRSAHHQWNEAQQAAVFEIHAAKALKQGDRQLAGIYKRAARLSLASMQRWVRPSGEMQIIKNWIDPKERFGYERYSSHSQYNLLPMSMLAVACAYAESTSDIQEHPAPADLGGFVFEIPELHKIFANAGGSYVEIDTKADPHYDATGLIRIHFPGVSPQLGPSDSILAHPAYHTTGGSHPPANTGVGVAWKGDDGNWHRVGELGDKQIKKTSLNVLRQTQEAVEFSVTYEGKLFGASRITETYSLSPGQVKLVTKVDGVAGPLRYHWPVLADDGRTQSDISITEKTVAVSQDGGKTAVTFSAPDAGTVAVGDERYPNHNGFARIAEAEFPQGGAVTLVVKPRLQTGE